MGVIMLSPSEWAGAGVQTQAGSQGSDDVTNAVNVAINTLNGALNGVGFIANARNFVTVMEEFGEGMEAALGCVNVDLQVVASGVKAAAAAFPALDARLASTFTQMNQQLSYFTNTASGVKLPTPTTAEQNALLAMEGIKTGSDNPGVSLSYPQPNPAPAVAGGVVGVIIAVGIGILAF